MDIEAIAVLKVQNEIIKYNCLKDYINKNDKTPMWDGEIYIYKENSKYKSNEDFEGKISVQVKGHKVSKIKKGNSKYPINVEYLRAYQKEKKGVLLFVVEIVNSENTQLYYANLLPVDLKEILERAEEGQKSITIDIKPIREKSPSSMKMICQNFLRNSNEQMNIEIKSIEEIKDIKEINFTIVGEEQYIEEYILNNDIYTYAIDELSNKKIALPKLKEIYAVKTIKSNVKIKDKDYYKQISFIKKQNEEYTLIGKSTKIYFSKNQIKFNICGNIYERIIDLNFIRDLLKNGEVTIKDNLLPMKVNIEEKSKDDYIKKIGKDLIGLNKIKEIFNKYNVKFEKDLSILDEKSRHNLTRFVKLNSGELIDGVKESNVHYIDIAEYRIAFMVSIDSNKNVNVYNYFEDLSDKIKVFYLNKDNEEIRISPYINLTADNLLTFSNINIDVMKKSFESEKFSEETCERYNLWLLNLIKAYDKSNDKKWLEFAEYLIEKILAFSDSPLYRINKLQIIKRIRKLNLQEKEELYKIKEKEDDYMIQCGIAILLENISDFERYFSKLENKDAFVKFPIYNLLK